MVAEGQVFAGYLILRLLGSGGMGQVYLAKHPRLPRQDALKVLRTDVSSDATFGERFIREADLAAALWHPHIVGVHDRGEHQGQLWIAMDYVDGVDAAQLMQHRYPAGMPAEEVADIVSAVASALDYAHKRGLLHRDVKPANVMLAHLDDHEERRILLTDFGIARELNTVSGLTTTNMTVGTVAYAAPEQLMGHDIDGRADQYALAATAFQLLTGTPPFSHSNPAVVISHHLNASPPALADTRGELASLDPVLAVALAKDPDQRYARCSDFARAFAEQIRGDAPAHAAPTAQAPVRRSVVAAHPHPPTVPGAHAGQSSATRRWLPLGAAAAAGVLAVGGALVWRPWDTRHDEVKPNPPTTSEAAVVQDNQSSSAPSSTVTTTPTTPATAVDNLLLSDGEIGRLLGGIEVSSEPGGTVGAALKLDSSSYGPGDHSRQVEPVSCVGIAFTGDKASYGGTDVEALKTEEFSPGTYAAGDQGPTQLEQTVAVFPSAASARDFLAAQQRQWTACTSPENPPYPDFPEIDVSVLLGYEDGRSFVLGNVDRVDDTISASMASNNPVTGAHACQQALGVRNNVAVEVRICHVPSGATSIPPLDPADPDWAVPDAQRLVEAMLNKVV